MRKFSNSYIIPPMSKLAYPLAAIFLLGSASGCAPHHVESSVERDQRETKALAQSQAGRNLLGNRWCSYVAPNPKVQFHGFLRLSFRSDLSLIIEQYAEANGKPFGKTDNDKLGLWALDREELGLQTDKSHSTKYKISFGEQKAIPVMNLVNVKDGSTALMWTCNKGVDDPMPITVESGGSNPPVPLPNTDDDKKDNLLPRPGEEPAP